MPLQILFEPSGCVFLCPACAEELAALGEQALPADDVLQQALFDLDAWERSGRGCQWCKLQFASADAASVREWTVEEILRREG